VTDITIITCKPYHQPSHTTPYIQNILDEYQFLKVALEERGLQVERTYWDDPNYDWTQTRGVVIRTIWDYFERFDEFWPWLENVQEKTILINPFSLVQWNIDKHYLMDLSEKGIQIVPTHFVDRGGWRSLKEVCELMGWSDIVIKPAISGAAFHTYKITASEVAENEALFKQLVSERDMLVQPYQSTITTLGEASLMVFNGNFTHAILKKAKPGDFRVQDDFGGTVYPYQASRKEIDFAEKVFAVCDPIPAYGRADIIWDEQGEIYLSELEIVEPELWVRNYPAAAKEFAAGILRYL
jgi:glutathione synthase/RimK-type ligase-like ATP-grasp enzyme